MTCTNCGHVIEPWQPVRHAYQFPLGADNEPVKTAVHANWADCKPTEEPTE